MGKNWFEKSGPFEDVTWPKLHRVPTFAPDEPVYIIGEAGSSWRAGDPDHDMAMAMALIDVAAEAGCDAVKFQVFRPETTYAPNAGSYRGKNVSALFADLAMPYEMIPLLAARAAERNIAFMATPFSVRDAEAVDPYVAVHKIASYELNHRRLLERIARTGKPVILSTGAAEFSEILSALDLLRGAGVRTICILQCTAQYPAACDALHLRVIPTFARLGVAAGLSDHSLDPLVGPLGAVALGARCVEKHFTLSRRLPGPDHAHALEPDELRRMVNGIRAMESALGSAGKRFLPEEYELRCFAVRRLQSTRDIARGERLVEGENFDALRPGQNRQGGSPMRVHEVAGRAAARDIHAGDGIEMEDLA